MNIKITGSGSYIPSQIVTNQNFIDHKFLNDDGSDFGQSNDLVAEKFRQITGIEQRRYCENHENTSDIAFFAAALAIKSAQIDPETLDYIILAHNYGDIKSASVQSDTVPCLAARVKHKLQIRNPKCVAYDILFGCPGWIEGVIQARAFITAGMAKKCLVIGAETLSRIVDVHDRDSMIYADGAGATVIEAVDDDGGIIAHETATYSLDQINYLNFGNSFNKNLDTNTRYLKMQGRKIYEFALNYVPLAMKDCLDKSGITIDEVTKILIHQANEKMDEAIVSRFYKLYGKKIPNDIMPMSIKNLGNSSVATIPTLYDLIKNGKIANHKFIKGDVIMFASVGAGMNINAIVYRI